MMRAIKAIIGISLSLFLLSCVQNPVTPPEVSPIPYQSKEPSGSIISSPKPSIIPVITIDDLKVVNDKVINFIDKTNKAIKDTINNSAGPIEYLKDKVDDVIGDFFEKPKVNSDKDLPVARINTDPLSLAVATTFTVPKTIRLSAERSTGIKLSYNWKIIALNSLFKKEDNQVIAESKEVSWSITLTTPGFYELLLSVYDEDNNVSSKRINIWARE